MKSHNGLFLVCLWLMGILFYLLLYSHQQLRKENHSLREQIQQMKATR